VTTHWCEADTTAGKIRGIVNRGIHAFLGVPYGAPTGGRQRFRPSQRPAPWSGVREALEYGDQCPQPESVPPGGPLRSWVRTTGESEDCLVLNVWTPGLRDGGKRPVMVWFHGGGFSSLSGSARVYDGKRLSRRGDVVVVTLNHRINVFGYLYLAQLGGEEFADSGNVGQLDLVEALAWVRDNIAGFGGDPGNVTIFGESGGGGKVAAALAMKAAHGLFQRAIVQSGPYLRAMTPEDATKFAVSLMRTLGLRPNQVPELQQLPAAHLVEALHTVTNGVAIRAFLPVLDGRALNSHPFHPEAPAISARVPLIVGYNKDETTLLFQSPDSFALDWETLPAKLDGWLRGAVNTGRVIELYRRLHPDLSASDLYFEITADRGIGAGSIALAERKVRQQAGNVFLYRLEWETPVLEGRLRASHALDLPLVFDNVAVSDSFIGDGAREAQQIAEQMSEAWIAFARSGDPGTRSLQWPAYQLDTRPTMIFNVPSCVVMDPRKAERELLATLPEIRPMG
jgi:para-nitrobenzyl esterase